MGTESDELKRQKNAARMREVRRLQREEGKDEPKKPRGRKPPVIPRSGRSVYLSDEEWNYCKAQTGGGSVYIQRLIAADRSQQKTGD